MYSIKVTGEIHMNIFKEIKDIEKAFYQQERSFIAFQWELYLKDGNLVDSDFIGRNEFKKMFDCEESQIDFMATNYYIYVKTELLRNYWGEKFSGDDYLFVPIKGTYQRVYLKNLRNFDLSFWIEPNNELIYLKKYIS